MLERMPGKQLQMWLAYQKMYGPVNPIIRNDIASAGIAQIMAQTNAKKGKRFKLSDFLNYNLFPEKPEATEAEYMAQAYALAAITGGEVVNKNG